MTDTARVLLTAAVLTASGIGVFAWRVIRLDAADADRLIAELRLAQIAAILLAAMGAAPIGLAVAGATVPGAHLDATIGIFFVVVAAFVLWQGPQDALLVAAGGFLLHALATLAHRPGLLPADLAPRWFTIASATYDVYLAAICYVARRR